MARMLHRPQDRVFRQGAIVGFRALRRTGAEVGAPNREPVQGAEWNEGTGAERPS